MDCQVNGVHLENDLNAHLGQTLFWLVGSFGGCWRTVERTPFFWEAGAVGPLRAWPEGVVPFESGPVQVYQEFRTAAIGADVLLIDIYITDPLWS